MPDLRHRAEDETGFTLIELLVVTLVIGILAAIAIPSFLNETGKAVDVSAKELAHVAQVAAESYATDHDGSYANLSAAALQSYEQTIPIAANGRDAWVSAASGTASGYVVTTEPASGPETFTITRSGGAVTRTCTPAAGSSGGCVNGSW